MYYDIFVTKSGKHQKMWQISKKKCRNLENKFSLLNASYFDILFYYIKDYKRKFNDNSKKSKGIINYLISKGEVENCFKNAVDTIYFNSIKKSTYTKNEIIYNLLLDYQIAHYSNGNTMLIDFIKKMKNEYEYNEETDLIFFYFFYDLYIKYYEILYIKFIEPVIQIDIKKVDNYSLLSFLHIEENIFNLSSN